ncbi:MAG: hypothetical protein NUV98_03190 [Candidatus Roizmanbacteria bacterium]|nr:hypothetical protein [Candidatus Roizmanbacteria bacterium]
MLSESTLKMATWFFLAIIVVVFLNGCDAPAASNVRSVSAEERPLTVVEDAGDLPYHLNSISRVENKTGVAIYIMCESRQWPAQALNNGATFPGYNLGECPSAMMVYYSK